MHYLGEMIPAVLKEVAPEVGYIHGSPISSNWGIPESFLSGDSHNWRVWFKGDFTEFDETLVASPLNMAFKLFLR